MNIKRGDNVNIKILQTSEGPPGDEDYTGIVKRINDFSDVKTVLIQIPGLGLTSFYQAPGAADDIFYYEEGGYSEQSRITKV